MGAVIDQQNFQIGIVLAADALHTAGNVLFGIVDGHNDADQRLFHRASLP